MAGDVAPVLLYRRMTREEAVLGGYEFLTSWCVDAPIEPVFAVLRDSAAFPEWWKGVTAVEMLEPGEADGVGEGGVGLAERLGASLLVHD